MKSMLLHMGKTTAAEKSQGRLNSGDLREIYEAYYKRVYNYISYRIDNHHDTGDLVSLVFEKVIKKYGSYNPQLAVFEAWLMAIARNTVRDYLRARRYSLPLEIAAQLITGKDSPEAAAIANENKALLMQALKKLGKREREIVALKYGAELRHKEIGALLGISPSHVGVILFRSLDKLRRELGKELD